MSGMAQSQNYRIDYRNEYEQEIINLKDVVFYILYRWRSLLLTAILVCIFMGGYAVWYNSAILPEKKAGIQEKLEEQQRLIKEGQENKESVEQAQKQVTQLKTELEGLKEYSLVKYSGIGFGSGLFVIAACYGIFYMFSDKMRGEREMRDKYGYYLLGTFPRQRKGKPLSGIDRFLEKKEGGLWQLTVEEAYRIISANITNHVRDGGVILVTGTVDIGRLQEFTKALLPQLQENVSLMTGADMSITASTLEALAECDRVILVEEKDTSLRAKIQKECENIEALGKMVVGYVVI